MLTRYVLVLLATIVASSAWAQGLVTLRNSQGEIVNGSLVSHSAMQSTDTVKLVTRLNGSEATQVNVRRYELWTVPNTENFFCWGVCYLPVGEGVNATWLSQHYVDMNPNANYNNFAAYYVSNGQSSSTTRYRFVWFDVADPLGADSSWVDIEFGGTVGLNERNAAVASLSVWPNPSNGEDVQLDYTIQGSPVGAQLVLYSVLGQRLRSIALPASTGRVSLATIDLNTGVYFANLERNGRVLGTRRIVVTR